MLSLSSRQSFILTRVVDTFIETGHPVSSKAVAFASPSPVSSATIRHEMGVLEETGYLIQAHHSSGRIPTDSGYRHYLDRGLPLYEKSLENFQLLPEQFLARFKKIEETQPFLEEFASVLSDLSQQLGVFLVPNAKSSGLDEGTGRMAAKGLRYLLDKPECQDAATLKPLVEIVEEKETLKRWIHEHAADSRPRVFVGAEHEFEALEGYAIVTARFETGKDSGALAVIGLKRMAYSKVLPIVTEMTRFVGMKLQDIRNG